MLSAGAPKKFASGEQPLVKLIGELANRTDYRQIFVQKKGFNVRFEKHNPRLKLRSVES